MFCCFLCCCKQKVSSGCVALWSVLLFLAGGFTIYVSVCLFLGVEILGGLTKTGSLTSTNNNQTVYLNSYLHMFFLISGIIGVIIGMLGWCTCRAKSICCISFYTIILIIFCALFTIVGLLMISIQ